MPKLPRKPVGKPKAEPPAPLYPDPDLMDDEECCPICMTAPCECALDAFWDDMLDEDY